MRRTGGLIVAATLLAACSSGGSDDVADETRPTVDPPSVVADDELDPSGEKAGGSSEDPPVVEPDSEPDDPASPTPDDLPLPGLLDTSDASVPNDPAVRTGTLDNGLRYYIRENDNPGAKADLRLAIDAGSVDEFGPSTGVAHFVEHMLFNGTDQFPENELVATLRSFGAAFGADVNARTGYDSTVYQLTVPNAAETVELGLTVLEQWLSHATIEPDQVVAERGVVLDEWRVRTQTTNGRRFPKTEQMFLAGTPYEGRSPIGTDASISAMEPDELRAYYDRFYRPDNAAVLVVGDIDVDDIEADIERLFGPAVARSSEPLDDTPYDFPIDLEPDAFVHLDPDQPTVDVEVTFPLGEVATPTTAGARTVLLDVLAQDALLRRLDRDVAAGTAPFDDITRGSNSLVTGLEAPGLYAFTDAARVEATLEALLDEFERARRFGFDQTELDTARDSLLALFRTRYDGRESNQDSDYAESYVDDFLDGDGYPSIEVEFEVISELLEAVTVDALDLRYRTRLANTAPHVIVSAPESQGATIPDAEDLLAVVAATSDRVLLPREGSGELPDQLMDRPDAVEPIASADVVTAGNELFDPLRLDFPNGVTVILNTNEIVEGQIYVQGASRGGLSLVADEDVVDALYATDVVTASGVAEFDAATLDDIIAGADVSFDAWLEPYTENVGGVVATADLEVMLQLIHLSMTRPRADDVALRQVRSRVQPIVDDPSSDAGVAGADALLDARYPGEPRYAALPTPDEFATLDLDGVRRVWAERFGNVDDWVFVFSGDLDIDVAAELAGAYLGTLSAGSPETPVDVEDPPPPGVVRTSAIAGTGDSASLTMLYTAPVGDVTAEVRATADVVTEVVAARLIDVVRERLGDSYSPTATTYVTLDPDPMIETYVSVTGSPDRVGAIGDLVAGEIADLASAGPDDQEYRNAFAQVEERYRFVNNWEFVTELLDDALQPALDLDDYLFESAALGAVDAAAVQSFIARYVPPEQYIQVTVTPG